MTRYLVQVHPAEDIGLYPSREVADRVAASVAAIRRTRTYVLRETGHGDDPWQLVEMFEPGG